MKKIENNFTVSGFVGKDAEIRLRGSIQNVA